MHKLTSAEAARRRCDVFIYIENEAYILSFYLILKPTATAIIILKYFSAIASGKICKSFVFGVQRDVSIVLFFVRFKSRDYYSVII